MIKYVINTERARKTKIREKTRMTTFLSSKAATKTLFCIHTTVLFILIKYFFSAKLSINVSMKVEDDFLSLPQ